MPITVYFISGEKVVLNQTTEEFRSLIEDFKPGESGLAHGGRAITFNPAHITHILDYGDEQPPPGTRASFL